MAKSSVNYNTSSNFRACGACPKVGACIVIYTTFCNPEEALQITGHCPSRRKVLENHSHVTTWRKCNDLLNLLVRTISAFQKLSSKMFLQAEHPWLLVVRLPFQTSSRSIQHLHMRGFRGAALRWLFSEFVSECSCCRASLPAQGWWDAIESAWGSSKGMSDGRARLIASKAHAAESRPLNIFQTLITNTSSMGVS